MLKKSLLLVSLLTLSNNIWASATFTDKAQWEASLPGIIVDQPVFGACKGDVGAYNCTGYPTGIFTDTKFDTKVAGQEAAMISFGLPQASHGIFTAIGFNIDSGGVDISQKIWFSLGSNGTYSLPTGFTGGFFGITTDGLYPDNAIKILPLSTIPTTYTLSDFQTSAPAAPAPEPETYAMILLGIGGISARHQRKKLLARSSH
ncbi:MAG: PEP-CTERM sorting domain-containing protein [Pseudomonadota bacterium]